MAMVTLWVESHVLYKHIIIANLDCHDLNVSALAPPIT